MTAFLWIVAAFLAIAAGGCAAPLTTSATPQQLAAMMTDSGAEHLFIDRIKRAELADSGVALPSLKHVMMDAQDDSDGAPFLFDWMADEGATPLDVETGPNHPYNIIYSSGTTGTPSYIPLTAGDLADDRRAKLAALLADDSGWEDTAGSREVRAVRCVKRNLLPGTLYEEARRRARRPRPHLALRQAHAGARLPRVLTDISSESSDWNSDPCHLSHPPSTARRMADLMPEPVSRCT